MQRITLEQRRIICLRGYGFADAHWQRAARAYCVSARTGKTMLLQTSANSITNITLT